MALVCAVPAQAQQRASHAVQARVHFEPRTSLTVSTSVLQFHHVDPTSPSIVTVDFTARARTHASGEVVLTVESLRTIEGPGGAADVDTEVTFTGVGAGTLAGALDGDGPSMIGRWAGSGIREGRVAFALRSPVAGDYTLPVRFVISAP
jgi:hypothetical protein